MIRSALLLLAPLLLAASGPVQPQGETLDAAVERARVLAGLSGPAYAAVKRRSRTAAVARFDQARDHDPFLDFWFSEEAKVRIHDMVARLKARS